jgi:hypothetical protein
LSQRREDQIERRRKIIHGSTIRVFAPDGKIGTNPKLADGASRSGGLQTAELKPTAVSNRRS